MADKLFLSCTLISLLLFLTLVSSSRTTPQRSKTSTLDISSSIQQARNYPHHQSTSKPQQQKRQPQYTSTAESDKSSSPPSLSVTLHPRLTVTHQGPKHSLSSPGDFYKSLVLSRLERDSSRVKSLQTRLELKLNGIQKSDLKPLNQNNLEASALESPVLSGTSLGSGEYFSRVGIGRPPKQVYVVLDTGSDISWIQCAPCGDCYQQADPIFEPTSSATYNPLSCQTQQCQSLDVSECRGGRCLYEVSYGDGSYTVGDFVTETVTFDRASVNNIALGCGHNNEGLFVGAAGLLGLGGGALSFPSQMNSSSFSYCLVDRDSDSASTLDFDTPLPANSITAPLLRNRQMDTFYYVGLTGISVSGERLSLPTSSFEMNDETGDGGIIVDSGTAITRLPTDVYNALRDKFKSGTGNLPSAAGVALFDTCYNLGSMTSVEVPAVMLHFGEDNNKELQLPAKNYMIPVDSSGTFCLAFAPTTSSLGIIGNVQQQGTRVTFDLANKMVAFSPSKC